jgi:hypothetical protein
MHGHSRTRSQGSQFIGIQKVASAMTEAKKSEDLVMSTDDIVGSAAQGSHSSRALMQEGSHGCNPGTRSY